MHKHRGVQNPRGGRDGGRWAQLEQSLAAPGQGTSQGGGGSEPHQQSGLGPCGQHGARGALSDALSSGLRRRPPGPVGLPLFIRHCEHIPLSVHFLISHLFVCLLTICCWNKIRSTLRDAASVRKSGSLLCHRAGGGAPSQTPGPPRTGHGRSSQKLLLSAQVLGLSRSPGTPRLDQGRTGALEVQKEATQSKGRERSPATSLLFAFHGSSPGPRPPPHWACQPPRLQPAAPASPPRPSGSL